MSQLALELPDPVTTLLESVDERRLEANAKLNPKTKAAQGQFMTPRSVAEFMASLFSLHDTRKIRLLDAGAGVGSLTAAFVREFCARPTRVKRLEVTAYETEPILGQYLQQTFGDCREACAQARIPFAAHLEQQDFIETGVEQLVRGLQPSEQFTHTILNPPYKKIHSKSIHRGLLRSVGVETGNLYTGFLAIALKLLQPAGELVAITPRSFCNGPYFKPFRELLLRDMSIQQIHVFESRTHAFKDDEVLQENIILHAVKGAPQGKVVLSMSSDAGFANISCRTVDFRHIVDPQDRDCFIHIRANEKEQHYIELMQGLPCTLRDLGVEASTGPVVDFRLAAYIRHDPELGTVPLIYPGHCKANRVTWPLAYGKKPNAITLDEPVQKWLFPNGHYVVIRRFSAKEERRRVVAAVHDPESVPGEQIGFENHLNVLHHQRQGLSPDLVRGLAVYLNSTLYDVCFRQFNGHTQVNVRDLYNLRYPTKATLEDLGKRVVANSFPTQDEIDAWIEEELVAHAEQL